MLPKQFIYWDGKEIRTKEKTKTIESSWETRKSSNIAAHKSAYECNLIYIELFNKIFSDKIWIIMPSLGNLEHLEGTYSMFLELTLFDINQIALL